MAVNLVELAKGYLTPDVVQKAATFVGESESATQKAMNGIVPTLIAALANQASTTGGAEKLSQLLDAGNYDGGALNNPASLFGGGETTQKAIAEGKNILSSLFGGKIEGLVDQITRFAGVRPGSASSLLALLAQAKAGLSEITQQWTAATEASKSGNLMDAVTKASSVKVKAAEVLTLLKMPVPEALKS